MQYSIAPVGAGAAPSEGGRPAGDGLEQAAIAARLKIAAPRKRRPDMVWGGKFREVSLLERAGLFCVAAALLSIAYAINEGMLPGWFVSHFFVGIMCLSVGVLIGAHQRGEEYPPIQLETPPEPETELEAIEQQKVVLLLRPRA